MTQELNKEGLEVDYRLSEMPNGEFVAEVYYLTHEVGKLLGCDLHNEQFCAIEKLIRDYVWKSCQRAYLSHPKVAGFESRIADAVDDLHDNGFDDVIVLLEDMQAALAGGGHE